MEYLYRIADKHLEERLEAFGAVLIEGPKWCGKTTTAKQLSKSMISMQDPDLLIILTGGSMAYTRTDGVKVIPLACLKD